jgi:hypothetical protein
VTFIDGIYNYCDRWCERCRFQTRCRLYRDRQRMEQYAEGCLDKMDLEALHSDEAFEIEASAPPISARERAEFLEMLAEANREPSPEESARIDAADARQTRQRNAHPLSRESMEYATIARRALEVVEPAIAAGGDLVAHASVDTIGRFAFSIAVKTRRAVTALGPASDELGDDDEFRRSDGNGCAKLVRLMIAESRQAWEVLMHVPAAADGDPPAMIRRLQRLDAHVEGAFPRAMAFVRPGLDED